MRFRDYKISTKYAISFFIVLIIMASLNVFTINYMITLKGEANNVSSQYIPAINLIYKLSSATENYRINQLQFAVSKQGAERIHFKNQMNEFSNNVKLNISELDPYIKDERAIKLFVSIKQNWKSYYQHESEFISIASTQMEVKAIEFLNFKTKPAYDELRINLYKLSEFYNSQTTSTEKVVWGIFHASNKVIIILYVLAIVIAIFFIFYFSRIVVRPIKELESAARLVTSGVSSVNVNILSSDEIGQLAKSFNEMVNAINRMKIQDEISDWQKSGENGLNMAMRGDNDIPTLAKNVIGFLANYLEANIGALYIWDEDEKNLKLTSAYAYSARKDIKTTLLLGEGYVGQAALEKEAILLTDIPENYIYISSSLGYIAPKCILVCPFIHENNLLGVIELGSLNLFSKREIEFIKSLSENIGVSFYSAISRNKITYLLKESRLKSQELQKQQEELKASNEELEAQTSALIRSEERLREQQEELQAANEELEDKTKSLEKQRNEIAAKNADLEIAQKDIEKKAHQLEITSKYKSEFLANMSHELRTPLNSLLILARDLSENKENNLTSDQSNSLNVIYKSGSDLLNLINEILDLSKIEAGKMSITIEEVEISNLVTNIRSTFGHVAHEKGLDLLIHVSDDLPLTMKSDQQRIEQVIKNLISNALKFTHEGQIDISFIKPLATTKFMTPSLSADNSIGICVTDTGIGIPESKQRTIFEAFQQAEGGTARKYGGTGLGLSISRELAKLLGGEIHLESKHHEGSTFTLYLPLVATKTEHPEQDNVSQRISEETKLIKQNLLKQKYTFDDDRTNLGTEKCILIVEDDKFFAQIMYNQCKQKGFKCLVALSGEEGLELAAKFKPTAIILDLKLPGIDGWQVLESLKNNAELRHIPVHIMSVEEAENHALNKGAIGFLTKPAKREDIEKAFNRIEDVIRKNIKDLLIVEDNALIRKQMVDLINDKDVKITEAATAHEVFDLLSKTSFDCIVLDLGLPDMNGYELLNQLSKSVEHIPPVIIYTGRDLNKEEEAELKKYADSIIIKGAKSEDRLLDETALFLHRVVDDMEPAKRKMIINLHDKDTSLKNKRVLLVDDDMRNVFAMSKVLKNKGMIVDIAENGLKALDVLEKNSNFDIILMDIMMPIMDGYEAIRNIRKQERWYKIPIIALTAKAMKDDKDKCIQAGASDYMTKPIDVERLFSVMRVWLYS